MTVLSVSVIKTNLLILYRAEASVYCKIHTKYINEICDQNVEFSCAIKAEGIQSNR